MTQETVYDYVMKTINDKDFEMLHQYTLDKIRSCDFGPKYEHDIYNDVNDINRQCRRSWETHSFSISKFNDAVKNIPLTVSEYMYNNIEYPKIIHKYLRDNNFTNNECVYSVWDSGWDSGWDRLLTNVKLTCDKSTDHIEGQGMFSHEHYTYIPYKYLINIKRDHNPNHDTFHYELMDFFPQYIEPKHSKQDYINYFITNDFNCNRLRELIIKLSKSMLSRREEDLTQHVKHDFIIDDLQLLINYAQQLIIECKEYLDKQTDDSTIKLAF